jgi:hypothetical protein
MVLDEWNDARLFHGKYNEETFKHQKKALFNSLGFLINKDEITTILAAECNDEQEYIGITLIPTGSIIPIKKLTLVPTV